MKKKRTRIGVIGCGGAGTDRTRQLARHELGVDIVAAVDIDPPRLDNLERLLGYKLKARYTSEDGYRRMIDEVELDGVGVFTPHELHYEHAKYALEKGLHLLIEKPMVCGTGRAIEIARLAAARGIVAVLHYQRHYEPRFIKARELIRKGAIGEVRNFYIYMVQDWYGRTWRGDPALSGGGQVNDSGSHYQDILLWMTDLLPTAAEGSVDYFYHGIRKAVEINGFFSVELSNGAVGRVIIVGDTIGGFTDDVRLRGTEGDLVFYGSELYLRRGTDAREISLARPRGYPVSPCDNFIKLIAGRARVNRVPLVFGARVATLTDAMLQAGRSGSRVACADLLAESGYTLSDLAL
ncbi:MAG: Gfo/Idh/MocA family oxidoreductase [Kiritimatiellaeota bacterium]|nr:Gfo/Idh/MocA family oxidoreductase [Kiritimatiellota bacterium]